MGWRGVRLSPADVGVGEVLADEAVVVGLELLDVGLVLGVVALAIQVALLEGAHPGQHLLVLLIRQVGVGVLRVPRIEAVEADDILEVGVRGAEED